jgi:hypothetical protein
MPIIRGKTDMFVVILGGEAAQNNHEKLFSQI